MQLRSYSKTLRLKTYLNMYCIVKVNECNRMPKHYALKKDKEVEIKLQTLASPLAGNARLYTSAPLTLAWQLANLQPCSARLK
jgi:hypothetical protein